MFRIFKVSLLLLAAFPIQKNVKNEVHKGWAFFQKFINDFFTGTTPIHSFDDTVSTSQCSLYGTQNWPVSWFQRSVK